MSNWGFFDFIGYFCFGIAALMNTLEQGVSRTPKLKTKFIQYLSLANLSYIALIFFLISLSSFAFGYFIPSNKNIEKAGFQHWPEPYAPIAIIDKEFTNERVILDGYSYVNCSFNNVTFVYNGTTALQFTGNKISGQLRFDTSNPSVLGTIAMLKGFGALIKEFDFKIDKGSNSKLEEIKKVF